MGEPHVFGKPGKGFDLSSDTKTQIESVKDEILKQAWKSTLELLEKHASQLEMLTEYLIEHQKIYTQDRRVYFRPGIKAGRPAGE